MNDMTKSDELLLDVNNIEVIYNHVILVLKGVSLSVPKGGITALLSGNGAGKTTTLKKLFQIYFTQNVVKSQKAVSCIAASLLPILTPLRLLNQVLFRSWKADIVLSISLLKKIC